MPESDDFYVGYFPKAPTTLARWLKRIILTLLLLSAAIAFTLVFAQSPLPESHFEFGIYRDYAGVLQTQPYPMLTVGPVRYLLVAPGKHGADSLVEGHNNQQATLKASLIYRGQTRMLEVEPSSLSFKASGAAQSIIEDLGEETLRGEIVDSKCYLGVMNPGEGHIHRDCAVRCISGGVPPIFISQQRQMLLTGINAKDILDKVGLPIKLRGRVLRNNGQLEFQIQRPIVGQ